MKRKKRNILFVVVMSLTLLISSQVFASDQYNTISLSNIGIENIEIPADYIVITRTETINTESFLNESDLAYLADLMEIENTYFIAKPSAEYEITIMANEKGGPVILDDFEGLSSEELNENLGLTEAGIEVFSASVIDLNGVPAVNISAHAEAAEKYCQMYMFGTEANGKYYVVTLRVSANEELTDQPILSDMEHLLNNMIIKQPSGFMESLLKFILVVALVALLYGLSMKLIVSFENKKRKEREATIDGQSVLSGVEIPDPTE